MWRRQSRALAASLAAHGLLAAALAVGGGARLTTEPAPDREEPVVLTEVEIWNEDPEPPAAWGWSGPGSGSADSRSRVGTSSPPRSPPTEREAEADGSRSESESESGSGSVTEGVPRLDPSRAAEAVVPDLGPPPPPQPLEMRIPTLRISPRRPRSELAPDRNGRFRVKDGPVTAHVERDGRVSFEDQSPIGVRVASPRQIKERVAAWVRDPFGESPADLPPIIEGRFELTDLALRAAGQDPYLSRKMDLLDRTRDERMGLAAAENSSNLKDALARTPAALDRIWRGPGAPAGKRRLLFALWDECAESGSSEVVATARAVRAAIVGFVRRRLPRGNRAAYSDEELDALNARRTSRERFQPYGP